MQDGDLLARHAELYFRTLNHTAVPLHAALVDALCRLAAPPLELATVLEDVGQAYLRLAEKLNQTLIRRGDMEQEADADDTAEARIDTFIANLVTAAGDVPLADGTTIDAGNAMTVSPFVSDAIKAALLLARSSKPAPAPLGVEGASNGLAPPGP